MTPPSLKQRLIKYSDLAPYRQPLVDAKNAGVNPRDIYNIIGPGITKREYRDKINLAERHGFCVCAAGHPPGITHSPYARYTTEIFIVFSSDWRFSWNHDCETETVLHPGDMISVPTNMFRKYQNIGDEYGMIFSILGHDDSGGGVIWMPEVLKEAKERGLISLENGQLIDTSLGEPIPRAAKIVPTLTPEHLTLFNQYTLDEMQQYIGRKDTYIPSPYTGFANKTPDTLVYYDIIGPKRDNEHRFQVKPGDRWRMDEFRMYGLASSGNGTTGMYTRLDAEVLFVYEGKFTIKCETVKESFCATLEAGDIMSFPINSFRSISSDGAGFAYLIVGTHRPEIIVKLD